MRNVWKAAAAVAAVALVVAGCVAHDATSDLGDLAVTFATLATESATPCPCCSPTPSPGPSPVILHGVVR